MPSLLKVTDVAAGYGNLQILDGVSLQAVPGKITVVVGPNESRKEHSPEVYLGHSHRLQGRHCGRRSGHHAQVPDRGRQVRCGLPAADRERLHQSYGQGEPSSRWIHCPRAGLPSKSQGGNGPLPAALKVSLDQVGESERRREADGRDGDGADAQANSAITRGLAARGLRIPPGDPDHVERVDWTIKRDVHIVALWPHMHLRGKSFRYEAHYPDGRSEVLLSVPRYDFQWQSVYRFVEPRSFPTGTKIYCEAHWDNSRANPANPDPSRTVTWGEQSWDEMMMGYLDYYEDDAPAHSS